VDVIVVTNLDRNSVTPDEAISDFIPFMDKHYKGKYRIQGRSIGIELSYVDLDVVITSAPSEAEGQKMYKSESVRSELSLEDFTQKYPWKLSSAWNDIDLIKGHTTLNEAMRKAPEWQAAPLWIPDRDAQCWTQTHPLEQIRWTQDKNQKTSGHYVNVVKAVKWMKLEKLADIKHPKGYPLEHMLGDHCPDNITSIAEGVVLSLENFITKTRSYRTLKWVPEFPDRGVPSHNVWKRISADEFVTFYDAVKGLAETARKAFDAKDLADKVKYWRELFGSKFPEPPKEDRSKSLNSSGNSGGGFSERTAPSTVGGSRFA
jgi:hypothetical protein